MARHNPDRIFRGRSYRDKENYPYTRQGKVRAGETIRDRRDRTSREADGCGADVDEYGEVEDCDYASEECETSGT